MAADYTHFIGDRQTPFRRFAALRRAAIMAALIYPFEKSP